MGDSPLAGASILLVEDNPITQYIVRGVVENLGARIEVADCGRSALERVAGQRFDLILMDCRMPVMDGFEATRHIRRREGAPKPAGSLRSPEATRTPIIALTANDMGGDRERCLAAGMDDFLSKTGLPEELRDCLERWLPAGGRRSAGRGPAAVGRPPRGARSGATGSAAAAARAWLSPPVDLVLSAKR